MPATTGPMTRALVMIALLRLTALITMSSSTISTTKARRAVVSIDTTKPPTSATP